VFHEFYCKGQGAPDSGCLKTLSLIVDERVSPQMQETRLSWKSTKRNFEWFLAQTFDRPGVRVAN